MQILKALFTLTFLILLLLPLGVYSQELNIYSLERFTKSRGDTISFSSLTDWYQFNDSPDSVVIENIFLGNAQNINQNYHVLNSEKRSRFFKHQGIAESDSIFIYSFMSDTVFSYRVADVPLIAFLSHYVHEPPFRQSDYMIGFDLGQIGVEHRGDYYSTLININKDNPFQIGYGKPIVWEKADSTAFPENAGEVEYGEIYKDFIRGKVYRYRTQDLIYFIQTLTDTSTMGYDGRARHLAIIDSMSEKIIFNKIYWEGESASLLPLNNNVEGHSWRGITLQWTGKIFKNKPPVVMGFQGHSFDCPTIDFISLTEPSVEIRCDNRH